MSADACNEAPKAQETVPATAPRPRSRKSARPANTKREVRELAGLYAPEAIRGLVRIARNSRVPHATRVAAWSAILDRAVGKPAVPPASEADDGTEIPVVQDELSALDRARRVAFILREGMRALDSQPVDRPIRAVQSIPAQTDEEAESE